MTLVKPPRLRRGDVIGLVAPASPPLSGDRVQAGVRYLEGLGYRVKPGRCLERRHGFFAGTDRERSEDLNAMFRDPAVRAVFALRGGYGTPRILPALDYRALRHSPKIIVGFSDLTALHLAIHRKTGLVTFSGPMAAVELAGPLDSFTEEQLWRQLTSNRRIGPLPTSAGTPLATLRSGQAEGPLLGGNLALVLSCLGTPFLPSLRGAILVAEDINENLHRIDRMFTQLRNAGILRMLAGLVLGEFTDCKPAKPGDPHLKLEEIFNEVAGWLRGPMASGLSYGHIPCKITLPLGLRTRLDTRRGRLEVLEAAVV